MIDLCTLAFGAALCGSPVQPTNLKEDYRIERIRHNRKQKYNREHAKANFRVKRSRGRCGIASFYGRELAGRRTANGERFKPSGLTAASWHHGFNERVTVHNPKNGKSVTVRINDRGPAKRLGRIIDLSSGAFRKIASLGQGLVRVCIR